MTGQPVVIVGAGGFGREVADVIDAINRTASVPAWDLLGVHDEAPSQLNLSRLEDRGIPYLGPLPGDGSDRIVSFVVGIGNPRVREKLADLIEGWGWEPATLVHPAAVLGSAVRLGAGTVICGGVQVSTNVHTGRHVHVNPNATIGHDARLEHFVSVNPAATVSGEVVVGSRTLLGANSIVLQGLTVGADALVGAAACAVREVHPRTTVVGVPAKAR
ncbi:acetyltransferase [Citricoccus zhacaiensis]